MPTRDAYEHGVPSWVDLSTTDVEASKDFYTQLFGWEWVSGDTPDGSVYWMASIDGNVVAGLGAQQEDMAAQGVPSMWNTYINVDDVDATTAAAEAAGARVLAPPMQIGESGRMASVMDPQGAAIGMWQAGEHKGAGLVNEHGAIVWNEVYAPDTAGAVEFYGTVFGWGTSEMPMPNGASYTTFVNGEDTIGGTIPPPMEQVPPHWHVWFASSDVDATVAKAEELGAMTLVPATDTPMGKMASFHDPTGAVFSVIAAPPQT